MPAFHSHLWVSPRASVNWISVHIFEISEHLQEKNVLSNAAVPELLGSLPPEQQLGGKR